MQIDGLRFVMLASEDIERSVAFYRDRLCLPLTARFEDFAFFDCDGTTLALSGALARGTPKSGTASEIVFGVPSVTAAFDELRAAGIDFANEPRAVNGNAWAVNLHDPDGHLLSFYGNP
ncbi:MAG TPA: VOC family protein [Candidatus Acidoferrales bacterium]|jgi:lactoylglutathione lyase|nr:VOC family protein [Candidatus Acidoferrales bacterium]